MVTSRSEVNSSIFKNRMYYQKTTNQTRLRNGYLEKANNLTCLISVIFKFFLLTFTKKKGRALCEKKVLVGVLTSPLLSSIS